MIKPFLDKVVLQIEKTEERTNTGIIITNRVEEKTKIAEVIAVGPGGIVDGKEISMHVSVGDKVIINNFSGVDIRLNNKDYRIVSQHEILGIIL